jgi:hypothetical protein
MCNMKIIQKSIYRAYKSWNLVDGIRCYHYAAAFKGNKMIEFAMNNPIVKDAKAYKLGQKFNIKRYRNYPYLHAESYLVTKLLSRYDKIDASWKIVVLRIGRSGKILLSKPCCNCQKILDSIGLDLVYWSIDENTWGAPKDKILRI